jgi:Ca2+-binding EF-hand superfamily protein
MSNPQQMANRWGGPGGEGGRGPRGEFGGPGFGRFSDRGGRGPNDNEGGDRTRRYAEAMLRRYDQNGNGSLEKAEWSSMREGYAAADTNRNAVITLDELSSHLAKASNASWPGRGGGGDRAGNGGSTANTAANGKKSYRFLSPTERLANLLPDRLREPFTELDSDGDGQVAMAEFTSNWSEDKVDEFAELDLNQDGMITPKEYSQARAN